MLQTKFIIQCERNLMTIDTEGILWIGNTGRVQKFSNPSVFDTRKQCQKAITDTIAYAKKNNYKGWNLDFKVIPITINTPVK